MTIKTPKKIQPKPRAPRPARTADAAGIPSHTKQSRDTCKDLHILMHPASTADTDEDAQDDDLIKETLRGIMRDPAAPAAARAQAARTMAEMRMMLGRAMRAPIDTDQPIVGLSRGDLERELAAMRGTLPTL